MNRKILNIIAIPILWALILASWTFFMTGPFAKSLDTGVDEEKENEGTIIAKNVTYRYVVGGRLEESYAITVERDNGIIKTLPIDRETYEKLQIGNRLVWEERVPAGDRLLIIIIGSALFLLVPFLSVYIVLLFHDIVDGYLMSSFVTKSKSNDPLETPRHVCKTCGEVHDRDRDDE